MNRIVRLVALVLLGAAVCQPRPAAADADYPNRSIRLVVPYAPGGVPDTSARLLAQKLQARIGQSVFVENRPGGNGGVAAAVINTSPADGYTLMVVDTTLLSVGPIFLNDLSFDPKKDFVPIAALARTPLFLAVNAQTPIKTLDEFVAYVRAHPGQLNYGSAGVGSTHQLTMEAMKAALHLDIVHVPYHGTGEAVPALLGNHVQALWAAYPSLKGAVERGDIRLLAHNGLGHSPLLPELPPLSDLVPGFDMVTNIGVYPQERQAVSLLHLHRRHPTGVFSLTYPARAGGTDRGRGDRPDPCDGSDPGNHCRHMARRQEDPQGFDRAASPR
jgi:tripartite-type tricarboxylate transporter receptor subunit TctC